jgi:hypothetical protein
LRYFVKRNFVFIQIAQKKWQGIASNDFMGHLCTVVPNSEVRKAAVC